jgi:hypothetical protein
LLIDGCLVNCLLNWTSNAWDLKRPSQNRAVQLSSLIIMGGYATLLSVRGIGKV